MARPSLSLCIPAFAACVLGMPNLAAAKAREIPADPKAVKVLGQWLAAYQRGKLDMTGSKRRMRSRRASKRAKDFVTITSGIVPEDQLRSLTHERELRLLCGMVVEMQNVDAAKALLEVAAVGLDKRKHTVDTMSVVVRSIGEEHLLELTAPEAIEHVVGVAGSSSAGTLKQAALRVVGSYADERYRATLESSLASSARPVRLAAATGLGRSKLATAIPALADRLQRERHPAIATALLDALTAIVAANGDGLKQRDLRRAATNAMELLGEHDWRVDNAVLDFLAPLAVADSIPALIGILERYAATGGKLGPTMSNVVLQRAHELLLSWTTAGFAIEDAAAWRAWWQEQDAAFQVTVRDASHSKAQAAGETGTASFFGIPVRGSRVAFVMDVSRSMKWKWNPDLTKFDIAKRELKGAIERLPANAEFNLITFAGRDSIWRADLVPATAENKQSFFAYVDRMSLRQSTNVWAGLQSALDIEWVAHGARYASPVDEVFVLSDGAPTTGDLRNPEHILETINETNRLSRVRINTVYIETDEDAEKASGGGNRGGWEPDWSMSGAELMKRLAEANGGRYLRPGK